MFPWKREETPRRYAEPFSSQMPRCTSLHVCFPGSGKRHRDATPSLFRAKCHDAPVYTYVSLEAGRDTETLRRAFFEPNATMHQSTRMFPWKREETPRRYAEPFSSQMPRCT